MLALPRNLTSMLVVEAPAARNRGTVKSSSANEASGKPSFPTAKSATCTLVPRMCCQDAEYHHPPGSLSFHSATGLFGEASGENAKMQIFVPFLIALQCNSCKAQHFPRHACLFAKL